MANLQHRRLQTAAESGRLEVCEPGEPRFNRGSMQIGEAATEEADTETGAAVVEGCSGGPNLQSPCYFLASIGRRARFTRTIATEKAGSRSRAWPRFALFAPATAP